MIKKTIFAHEIHMANRNDISFPGRNTGKNICKKLIIRYVHCDMK